MAPVLTLAWEPFVPDVTQIEFAPEAQGLSHLEPVNLRPVDAQPDENPDIAQYIALRSFTENIHLIVYRSDDKKNYFLKTWKEYGESEIPRKKLPPPTEFVIPEKIAALIYEIWSNALFEVRYSRNAVNGLDGTTYIFSTYIRSLGWLHGKTWSPVQDDLPPKCMVEAGDYLVAFATEDELDFEACEAKLTKIKERLFGYLEKHGKH